MSQFLDLAECYYAAAQDLAYKAQEYQRIADFLNRQADALCEQNIAGTKATPEPQPAGEP